MYDKTHTYQGDEKFESELCEIAVATTVTAISEEISSTETTQVPYFDYGGI